MAIGALKDHRLCCQFVDVRGPADLVTVATEYAGFEIIGDQEEDVLDLLLGEQRAGERAKTEEEKRSGDHGIAVD